MKFLIAFTALLVAGCAAFFSVKGIATLFSAAFVSALIMAGALEFGKLVAVSFLHRYWKDAKSFLKIYLSIAVVVLMLITSVGIFGFLTSAYQGSSLKNEVHLSKVESIESKKSIIEDEILLMRERIKSLVDSRKDQEARLDDINNQIGKTMTARSAESLQRTTMELIEQSSRDISTTQSKLDDLITSKIALDEAIMNEKLSNSELKDIQTFQFVADELNTDLDTVAKWFILIIIFVFDPLAVSLVLAYNTIVVTGNQPKIVKTPEKDSDVMENEPAPKIKSDVDEPPTGTKTEDPKLKTRRRRKTKTKTRRKRGPTIESKTEPEIESKIEPEIESKTEPEIESKTEPEIESKTEPSEISSESKKKLRDIYYKDQSGEN